MKLLFPGMFVCMGRLTVMFKQNAQVPGLAGQSRDYLMYAHVISKSPNSCALGVPLLACARRAAPETGPGAVAYLSYNPLQPRISTQTCLILSIEHNKHHIVCYFVFLCCKQNYHFFRRVFRCTSCLTYDLLQFLDAYYFASFALRDNL